MKAIIVCGGRAYADRDRVFDALDVEQPDHVISGGAWAQISIPGLIRNVRVGADWFAEQWANERAVSLDVVHANWTKYGPSAGPRRNQQMLDMLLRRAGDGYDIAVIAFPGGRGTADMVRRARAADVQVIEVPA